MMSNLQEVEIDAIDTVAYTFNDTEIHNILDNIAKIITTYGRCQSNNSYQFECKYSQYLITIK